jgi:O-antigen/teichoic acid export membrane protein
LVAWILGLSNRYFIDMYMELADVGLFFMAFKIASVIGVLMGSIGLAFSPVFYRLANKEGAKSLSLRNLSEKVIGSMIILTFIVTIFIPEVVNWALDKKYHGIETLIGVLMLSNLLISLMSVSTVLYMMQSKNTHFNLYAGLIAASFSILINYMLIPIYGLHGAVAGNILSSVILFLSQFYFATKGFFLKLPWIKIFMYLSLVTVFSFAIQLLSLSVLGFILKLFIVIACLLVYIFRKNLHVINNNSNT